MFDIGFFEFAALGVFALLIFGPDKLPKVAADAARMLRELRAMASGAKRELTEAMGPELSDFKDLGDLNPRTFVKKNFLDVLDDDTTPDDSGSRRASKPTDGDGTGGSSAPRPPSYDADTT